MNQNISLLAALALAGCATTGGELPVAPACDGQTMVETQLFFGMSRRTGGEVSQDDWNAFLQREVIPHFEEGFAVFETTGFWRDGQSEQTITEPSRMISRLLRPGDAEAIPLMIDAYKQEFEQESVLRVDSTVCARF